jgi:ribosome-associated toxin RatA of RatAB toxin-antitoxin module
MMRASTSIDIAASAHEIYALAEDVSRWPELLPHYRYVRILRESPRERLAVMAARRGRIGVRWTAVERLDPGTPRIEFTHVSGWTAGMEVAWRFDPFPGGTRVIIEHELEFRLVPLIGEWIGRRIIGDYFIQAIASKTLACFKELAEART